MADGFRVQIVSEWLRAIVVLTLVAAVFGVCVRFTGVRDVFCQSPDELSEIMPGLRLHGLPLFNISAPIRYNFVQSMFYSQHGLGDVSYYYLASGLLSLLHLPVSERWLAFAAGATNVALAVAGGWLGARLLGSAATGWLFALFVFVSPFYVFVSKTGWARLTWTPLLLVLLFLSQSYAMRRRGIWWPIAFCLLAGFLSLTDGFVMLPIVGVLGLLLVDGGPADRLKRLARDRAFVAACAMIAIGIAVDLVIGLGARRRGTDLTMMAYVLLRAAAGGTAPSWGVLWAWTRSVDHYFPFRGAWVFVTVAFVLASGEGVRGRMIGFVAAWWLLASLGVMRYAAAVRTVNVIDIPSWLNAYQLAVPSLLLVAWLIVSVAEGRFSAVQRFRPEGRARFALSAACGLAIMMAAQAVVVAYGTQVRFGVRIERLVHHTELPLSACRAVKAAAFFVRSHQSTVPYVFHLSPNVYLGHIGEFYYGLSYGRSLRPEDPNHLLDFGTHQFGRPHPPQAFYRPYGVERFDYYVDFVDERDPFKTAVVDDLVSSGAKVVCTIWEGGRPIGRILSFHKEPPADLDYRTAAASWDRTFGRAGTLLQQPLAGTAYHFGYNWRAPDGE